MTHVGDVSAGDPPQDAPMTRWANDGQRRLAVMVVALQAACLTSWAVAPAALGDSANAIPGAPRSAAARLDLGTLHSCAINGAGVLSCWGWDVWGQLGNGTALTADQPSPTPADTTGAIPDTWLEVSAHFRSTCAIAVDGSAWCWGEDDSDQLGNGIALTGDQPSPTPLDTTGAIPDTWTSISVGEISACAIATDGSVWCWGSDGAGRLGNGMALTADQPSPTPVDTTGAIPDTWTAISVVGQHACAIGADATAWCWGGDSEGELGNGDALTPHQASPTPVDTTGAIPDTWLAISASKQGTTCAIAGDATAWCWGLDSSGLLGNGAVLTDEQPSPSPVDTAGAIPDTWQAITVGTSACAIATDGSAWCWGFDANGSLGNGAAVSDAQHSPFPVDTAGSIPDTWQAISAGFHVCGRGADGTVWCWGDDDEGGLGNGAGLTADQHSPSCAIGCGITTRASPSLAIAGAPSTSSRRPTAPSPEGRRRRPPSPPPPLAPTTGPPSTAGMVSTRRPPHRAGRRMSR
jgi:alpha-tubulin suppressor-like RCC1 family protein